MAGAGVRRERWRGDVMKVFRVVVLMLAVMGGAYAVRRLVSRDAEVTALDLAPMPDEGTMP
jgi:hypothetical protein